MRPRYGRDSSRVKTDDEDSSPERIVRVVRLDDVDDRSAGVCSSNGGETLVRVDRTIDETFDDDNNDNTRPVSSVSSLSNGRIDDVKTIPEGTADVVDTTIDVVGANVGNAVEVTAARSNSCQGRSFGDIFYDRLRDEVRRAIFDGASHLLKLDKQSRSSSVQPRTSTAAAASIVSSVASSRETSSRRKRGRLSSKCGGGHERRPGVSTLPRNETSPLVGAVAKERDHDHAMESGERRVSPSRSSVHRERAVSTIVVDSPGGSRVEHTTTRGESVHKNRGRRREIEIDARYDPSIVYVLDEHLTRGAHVALAKWFVSFVEEAELPGYVVVAGYAARGRTCAIRRFDENGTDECRATSLYDGTTIEYSANGQQYIRLDPNDNYPIFSLKRETNGPCVTLLLTFRSSQLERRLNCDGCIVVHPRETIDRACKRIADIVLDLNDRYLKYLSGDSRSSSGDRRVVARRLTSFSGRNDRFSDENDVDNNGDDDNDDVSVLDSVSVRGNDNLENDMDDNGDDDLDSNIDDDATSLGIRRRDSRTRSLVNNMATRDVVEVASRDISVDERVARYDTGVYYSESDDVTDADSNSFVENQLRRGLILSKVSLSDPPLIVRE